MVIWHCIYDFFWWGSFADRSCLKIFKTQKVRFQLFCFSTNFNFGYIFLEGITGGILVMWVGDYLRCFFFTLVMFVTYPWLYRQSSSLRANLNPSESWLSEHQSWQYIHQNLALFMLFHMGVVMLEFIASKWSNFSVFPRHLLPTSGHLPLMRLWRHQRQSKHSIAILSALRLEFVEFWGEFEVFSTSYVYILNLLFKGKILVPVSLRLIEFWLIY